MKSTVKKKQKKPVATLEKRMVAAHKESTKAREEYQALRSQYEASVWEDFKTKWIGKYFKFEIGGPDLIKFGKVIGPEMSEGREWLVVLEIGIDKTYSWVDLQMMHWDISRFEHYKAEELNRVEVNQLIEDLAKYLNNNLEKLGIKIQ